MVDETLKAYIASVKKIPDDELELLASWAQYKALKKGQQLLKEGDVCRSFYLVKKGYLRTYYTNTNGDTINLNFTFEGKFTTNMRSFKDKSPSEMIIEAGEDAEVWVFDVDAIPDKYTTHPQITFARRIAVRILVASEEHSDLFKIYTPTERYRFIEKNNPGLLQRVSLSQIASYLGVSRETLSRIRAKNV